MRYPGLQSHAAGKRSNPESRSITLLRVIATAVLWTQWFAASSLFAAMLVPDSIEVGDGQVVRPILVQAAGPWTIENDVPWISVPVSKGYGDRNVDVTVQRNSSGADRSGSITLAGATFTVTQRAAGSGLQELWAMGSDSYSQLGYSPLPYRTLPVQVMDDVQIVNANAGGESSAFITSDGTLWTVGRNDYGQLGDGTMTDRSTSVPVAFDVVSVAAGWTQVLFVKADGTLWTISADTPPEQLASGVAAVAAGWGHSFFLKSDGTLWAMGENSHGQLGDGTTVSRNTPVEVASGVSAVAAGWDHSLFVTTDGTLWGMGANLDGQLGDATRDDHSIPVQMATGVVTISAGRGHSVFVKTDGTLWGTGCCLGNSTGETVYRPVLLAADVASVAAGYSHSLFVKKDGSLWAAGINSYGQLGDGSTENRWTPVQVASNVVSVAAGYDHSLFVRTDGTLWAMGASDYGQLGDGSISLRSSAVHVASGVKAMSAGSYHSLFLKTDDTLWAIGSNFYGELGDGTHEERFAPVQVASGVVTMSAGAGFSLFVKADGTLWAMGANLHGQLGDGTTTDRSTPVQVGSDVTAVATGYDHSLFVRADGTLWAMGDLSFGPDRWTTGTTQATPLQLASDVIHVAAGLNNSLYVTTDGTLWAMGRGFSDVLGYPSTTPVQLASNVSSVAISTLSPRFLKADGTLWTISDGIARQLASDVVSVAEGQGLGLFVKTDGTLWAMGFNFYGQLGDRTRTDRTDPVQVANNVIAVSAGWGHSLFIASGEIGIAPRIASDPMLQTAVIGGTATFTASATGSEPFSYQWKRNGTDIAGETGSTLTLSDVRPDQTGSYSVVVSNSAGSVTSNPAALTLDPTPRLINLSVRALAGGGDSTLILGFYIAGTGSKTVLVRGVGPKLLDLDPSIPTVVPDPSLTLYSRNDPVAHNDDWDSALAPDFDHVGAFQLDPGSKDAALVKTLEPGAYTVHLVNSHAAAEGLIEIYDLSRDLGTRLVNLSCRTHIDAGKTVIVGTYLLNASRAILVRNSGPALSFNFPDFVSPEAVLPDPKLVLFTGQTPIGENDDWDSALAPVFMAVGAFPFEPSSRDAAIRIELTQGGHTIHATGNGPGGVALVELYESP